MIQEIVQGIDFDKIVRHPNILIAARLWDDERYQAAVTCYKLMRTIDDMIDDRKAASPCLEAGEKALFTERINSWLTHLTKQNAGNDLSYSVTEEDKATIKKFKIPVKLFRTFAKSMLYDVHNNGFDSWNDFFCYAEGASVAPAAVFVHLCCLKKDNHGEFIAPSFDVVSAARPCALFSYLVHIVRDFQKDTLDNLVYIPRELLRKHNVTLENLKQIAHGELILDGFREIIREYVSYADKYRIKTLNKISQISQELESRYLLSLQVIFALYLQVFERIDASHGKFTMQELNPTPAEIRARVIEVIGNN